MSEDYVRAVSDYSTAFPASRKVYDERTVRLAPDGPVTTLRVPKREVTLSSGNAPLRLYDTSGLSTALGASPSAEDLRAGLPEVRAEWLEARRGRGFAGTQLYYARKGEVTPEMEFVAAREGLPAEFVRAEVARGRANSTSNSDASRPRSWI